VYCLVGLHLVALEKCGGNRGFLVTLSGCCCLNGLVLVKTVEHHLVIIWWLQSIMIVRGFMATLRGITKGNFSGILESSWSALFTCWFIQEHPHRGQA
jgi:hypothetical protein